MNGLLRDGYTSTIFPTGKLVLAVARLLEPDWLWHSSGGSSSAVGGYTAAPGVEVQWHWHVLLASPGYEYLGPAVRRRAAATAGAPALPSPSAVSQPVLESLDLSWHPRGERGGHVGRAEAKALEGVGRGRCARAKEGGVRAGMEGVCDGGMVWIPEPALLNSRRVAHCCRGVPAPGCGV